MAKRKTKKKKEPKMSEHDCHDLQPHEISIFSWVEGIENDEDRQSAFDRALEAFPEFDGEEDVEIFIERIHCSEWHRHHKHHKHEPYTHGDHDHDYGDCK